jgi:hypothetical protein
MINHFELIAHGTAFDVDAYLPRTELPVSRVWRRGSAHYKTSGIAVTLGAGHSVPLLEQERLAIEFLSRHRDALVALGREPGVEVFILRLHLRMPVREGLVGFCVVPSMTLMRHARWISGWPNHQAKGHTRAQSGCRIGGSRSEDEHAQ